MCVQTDFEAKLSEYQKQRAREKAEALALFEAFKEQATSNQAEVVSQCETKTMAMAKSMDEAKLGFQAKLAQFSEVVQKLEERANSTREEVLRVHRIELQQNAAQAQNRLESMVADRDQKEAELRAQLEAALEDDSAAAAVRQELQAEVASLQAKLTRAEEAGASSAEALQRARSDHAAESAALKAAHEAAVATSQSEFEAEAAKFNNMLGDRLAEKQALESVRSIHL